MNKVKCFFTTIWVIILAGLYLFGMIFSVFYIAIKEKIGRLK